MVTTESLKPVMNGLVSRGSAPVRNDVSEVLLSVFTLLSPASPFLIV